MNVVVSNQAVLEKNSPLLLTSLFFFFFSLVISPFSSSGKASRASLQRGGRRVRPGGDSGAGGKPHGKISPHPEK